jgi:fructose-bisphosphate aldolase, class II
MPLKSLSIMYERANKENYAIGAFNINTLDFLGIAFQAASEMKSPMILAATMTAAEHVGLEFLAEIVKVGAKKVNVPVALHLDHGSSIEQVIKCIAVGFNSVMIDGSHLSFEENIKLTKEVVRYAHPRGITVEAELGKIGGVEDDVKVADKDAIFTDPIQAEEFVKRTGCNALAIAVGTKHGAFKFKGDVILAYDRITEIKRRVKIPLVLHGASAVIPEMLDKCNKYGAEISGAKGVSDSVTREAIKKGINKINIDTDLKLTFAANVRELLATKPTEFDPRWIMQPAWDEIKRVMKEKMSTLGSAYKA